MQVDGIGKLQRSKMAYLVTCFDFFSIADQVTEEAKERKGEKQERNQIT